jgi:hypothetical protein
MLDELQVYGEPISLGVRLRGVRADVRGVAVVVVLRPVEVPGGIGDLAADEPVRLTWDSVTGSFVGAVTAASAGIYDLVVRAEAVPGAGDLVVAESVAVIEP